MRCEDRIPLLPKEAEGLSILVKIATSETLPGVMEKGGVALTQTHGRYSLPLVRCRVCTSWVMPAGL
jgi:hypothetical protein